VIQRYSQISCGSSEGLRERPGFLLRAAVSSVDEAAECLDLGGAAFRLVAPESNTRLEVEDFINEAAHVDAVIFASCQERG